MGESKELVHSAGTAARGQRGERNMKEEASGPTEIAGIPYAEKSRTNRSGKELKPLLSAVIKRVKSSRQSRSEKAVS
jgi:hypothetical protein